VKYTRKDVGFYVDGELIGIFRSVEADPLHEVFPADAPILGAPNTRPKHTDTQDLPSETAPEQQIAGLIQASTNTPTP
jgi:hypothetical protein